MSVIPQTPRVSGGQQGSALDPLGTPHKLTPPPQTTNPGTTRLLPPVPVAIAHKQGFHLIDYISDWKQ